MAIVVACVLYIHGRGGAGGGRGVVWDGDHWEGWFLGWGWGLRAGRCGAGLRGGVYGEEVSGETW
jgi:hypothetical protein